MKFDITHTHREHWFSVGIERTTGRHFLAFPVSVGVADYMDPSRLLLVCHRPVRSAGFRRGMSKPSP